MFNDARTSDSVGWSEIFAAVREFENSRRAELRDWSAAIERVGPCSVCGRTLVLVSFGGGGALTMCERVYAQIVRQTTPADPIDPPDPLRGVQLVPYPCEPQQIPGLTG